jgi:hypothetical protein
MKLFLPTALVCAALAACAPVTPQTRIDRNPQVFAALSSRDQTLVRQGQIARGMPPEAVMLAWGPPGRRLVGTRGSRKIERWDYEVLRPVYTSHSYGSFGYRHGAYGYHGHPAYSSFGFGPNLTYLPEQVASVWFENNRVEAWERLMR